MAPLLPMALTVLSGPHQNINHHFLLLILSHPDGGLGLTSCSSLFDCWGVCVCVIRLGSVARALPMILIWDD